MVESVRGLAAIRPVGRQAEVELVRARVREAASGLPGVVLVRGTTGIGKSTLLSMIRSAVRAEAEVLSTTCADGGPDFAVARSLFGAEAGQPPAEDERSRLRWLVRIAADRMTERPLVVVVDDAHRCDAGTARWLGLLARRASRGGLFVVLAFPCVERMAAEERFAELTGTLDTTVIDLGPLPEPEVRELLRAVFGTEPHEDFLRVCVQECNGNPGATLAYVARVVALGGRPDQEWARWLRAAATAGSDAERLAWLNDQPEPVRRYATSVAILGGADAGAAAALFELPAAAAETARTTLTLARVLTERGSFRSGQFRAGLLAQLDPAELAALRARAARLLSDEGRPCQEIAEQIVALPVITEPWMVTALREAAHDRADGPEAAADYLRRALEPDPGHVEIRLELARLLAEVDPEEARVRYAGVLGDIGDLERRACVAAEYGMVALRTGHSREAFTTLLDLWQALPGTADPDARAGLEATMLAVGIDDLGTVAAALGRTREIGSPTGVRTESAKRLALLLATGMLMRAESLENTVALVRSALSLPAMPHDQWDLRGAVMLHYCGAQAEAEAVVERAMATAEAKGDKDFRAMVFVTRAMLRHLRGELLDARADAEQALSTPATGVGFDDLRWARCVLASVCSRTGERERAARLLAELGEPRQPLEHVWLAQVRAHLLRGAGEPSAALDVLLDCAKDMAAMGVGNPSTSAGWVDSVALLVELGRVPEAVEVAERGADRVRRWDTPVGRGYALLTDGLCTGQAETLREAASQLAEAGCARYEVQALTALGGALLRDGQDKEARRQLRAAADRAVRCGDLDGANEARAALVRAGGRMGEMSALTGDVLTSSERRVAELAAAGQTNRQIADALFITVRTVESHLSNAYRKLGAQARADLAARLR
ncbi:LuxR C-terminal-related transcriptional regulator [Crossiella sp. SN42]|uniref:helix-turn-helix transcriptional regulator n=1 Tax=Crossiella sp. SN42 TaxID=2944808 RepID=UPI00207CB311|nr:AAA family ATPase [Crossiella sp. SN42]MCO1574230.1 LuxR C-terminal-related transcriptional regulator [Crossiella sp. SN42]